MSHAVSNQAAPAGCPQTAARYLLPGDGGSGQFGSAGPLFTHSVAKIVVCGYPAKVSEGPRRLVVQAGLATGFAASLESAPTVFRSSKCQSGRNSLPGTLELLATDAEGNASKPVVITVG